MRTTIDLPDDLFRHAKVEAARRGMKFKDYAAALFRQGLAKSDSSPTGTGHSGPLPVSIPSAGRKFLPQTNAELFAAVDAEEDARKERTTD